MFPRLHNIELIINVRIQLKIKFKKKKRYFVAKQFEQYSHTFTLVRRWANRIYNKSKMKKSQGGDNRHDLASPSWTASRPVGPVTVFVKLIRFSELDTA